METTMNEISDEWLRELVEWCKSISEDRSAKKLAKFAGELLSRREADRWIPVSEKLPDEGIVVLCFLSVDSSPCMVTDSIRNGEWKYFDEITHWRPLPPAPEGGGK
jgi:hypothetical protein